MKYLFVTIAIIISMQASLAQKTEYFDEYGKITSKDSSFFYLIGNQIDGLYDDTVKLYYTANNKLLGRQKYSNGMLNGFFTFYHQNGRTMSRGINLDGRPVGYVISWYNSGLPKQTVYYPEDRGKVSEYIEQDFLVVNYWDTLGNQLVINSEGMCFCNFDNLIPVTTQYSNPIDGSFKPLINFSGRSVVNNFQLKGKVMDGLRDSIWIAYKEGVEVFRETYVMGVLKSGMFTDKDGTQYQYEKVNEFPSFNGGYPAFYKYVGNKINYPQDARRGGIEGKVFVEFVVNIDGSITDVNSIKSPGKSLSQEAERIIRTSPKWNPGQNRGKPIRSKMVIPIIFKLG